MNKGKRNRYAHYMCKILLKWEQKNKMNDHNYMVIYFDVSDVHDHFNHRFGHTYKDILCQMYIDLGNKKEQSNFFRIAAKSAKRYKTKRYVPQPYINHRVKGAIQNNPKNRDVSRSVKDLGYINDSVSRHRLKEAIEDYAHSLV